MEMILRRYETRRSLHYIEFTKLPQELDDFYSYDDNDPRSNFISFPKGTLTTVSHISLVRLPEEW